MTFAQSNEQVSEMEMNNVALLPVDASEFLPAVCPPACLPLLEDDELVGLLEKAAESELDGLVQTLVEKGGFTCQLKGLKTFKENYPITVSTFTTSRQRFKNLVQTHSPLTFSDPEKE